MEHTNFERELPVGYREDSRTDASNKKFATVLTVLTFAIAAALIVVALVLGKLIANIPEDETASANQSDIAVTLGLVFGFIAFLPSIVIHELLHGLAYKRLTGEKLTFGVTLIAAFCGVPNIYVYRRTALISLLMPFTVFSAVLIPSGVISLIFAAYGSAAAYTVYIAVSVLFALHCGGCSGDLYVTYLFMTKYKDKSTLMRDTGPAQAYYVKDLSCHDDIAEPASEERL